MNIDNLPKIGTLLDQGWDLTISCRNDKRFHATVHLGRRHGADSHHYIGRSVTDAIFSLEQYIDAKERSPVRTGAPHE